MITDQMLKIIILSIYGIFTLFGIVYVLRTLYKDRRKPFYIDMYDGHCFKKNDIIISGKAGDEYIVLKVYTPLEKGTFKHWLNEHMPTKWRYRTRGVKVKQIER